MCPWYKEMRNNTRFVNVSQSVCVCVGVAFMALLIKSGWVGQEQQSELDLCKFMTTGQCCQNGRLSKTKTQMFQLMIKAKAGYNMIHARLAENGNWNNNYHELFWGKSDGNKSIKVQDYI